MDIRLAAGLLALAFVSGSPLAAKATDCSKAATDIEKALCSSKPLQSDDAKLNAVFGDVHAYGPKDKADALVANQRNWLKQRDQICVSQTGGKLNACLAKATEDRTAEILADFAKEHPLNQINHDAVHPLRQFTADFMLGQHLLHFDDNKITENDRLIFDAGADSGGLDIEDGYHTSETDAVAITLNDGGYLGCDTNLVLAARRGGPVQVFKMGEELEKNCLYELRLAPDGFRFSGTMDEVEGRTDALWHAKDGSYSTEQLTFHPVAGTTLAGMQQTMDQSRSPLANEEFFNVIDNLSDRWGHADSRMAKETLQFALLTKPDTTPGYIVLSGCNTSLRDACANRKGRYVSSTASRQIASGFIAISLSTKKAFYALDISPPEGMHPYPDYDCGAPHPVTILPEEDEWPPDLIKQLEDWISDEDCG